MAYEMGTPQGEVCQKAHLCREIHSFNRHEVSPYPRDGIPATSRVEFDRKVKLLGNSGQPEAESQFRRKVGESQSRRKYDRKYVKEGERQRELITSRSAKP